MDPLAPDPNDALAMTHWPPAPNPAAPYVQGAKDFLSGGIVQALRGQGAQLPGWVNKMSDVAQSEPFNAAIGMASPLTGGDIFARRIIELLRKLPDTGSHEGKVAIGELYDAYRKAHPRDYESPQTFGHRLVNAAKAQRLNLARLDLPEGLEQQLRLRSETPWGEDVVHFVRRPNP